MRRKIGAIHGLALLAVLGYTHAAPAQAAFPDVCKIELDERRAAELAQRNGGRITLHDLLGQAASAEVAGESSVELVLFVFRMRHDRVVGRYASPEFTVRGGRPFPLREVLAAGEPDFETFRFDPEQMAEATKPIPADAAVQEPGRFLIDGVIPFHPRGWEERDAFFIAAVPANSRLRPGSEVLIGVVFAAGQ